MKNHAGHAPHCQKLAMAKKLLLWTFLNANLAVPLVGLVVKAPDALLLLVMVLELMIAQRQSVMKH